MSDSSQRRGFLTGLAIVLGAVGLFFATCEPYDTEYHTGYSGEAARNHYLAAEKLLDRMGMPAESFADVGVLARLPDESATVVIPTERRALDPEISERLLEWAERGGHLVVVSWSIWDDPKRTPDPILDAVGVHQFQNKDDDEAAPAKPTADEPEAEPETPPDGDSGDPGDSDDDEEVYAEADFPDRDEPLEVRFDPNFRLDVDEATESQILLEIGDDDGSHWLTLRHGKGLVTALSDDYFMTQPQIGDLDHAELVYRMSRLGGHRGPVWFVFGDARPSALALVWRYGWMVATSAAVLLALWLWGASRRFGPLADDTVTPRRELMEHVRAVGRLEWRAGAGRELLSAARDALFVRMRERHPGFDGLDPAEQARALETLSGVPRSRVADALRYAPETDSGRFAAKVAILEKLRRSL
ncbi:MAG TPA: DUF4350 domain-containing protein [Myxococcota bacterium]|nr:DUF4350 domain-containing protein [Myxococcota bacterium]